MTDDAAPAEENDIENLTEPVSDADVTDVLPEDLDLHGMVGPYVFPNNNRRRVPGVLYGIVGVAACIWYLLAGDSATLINRGVFFGALGLIAVGIYSFIAGWNLDVDETDALVEATRTVGFPVGHASAQMGWRGWLSRPTWRILLYSNEAQPTQRGLVLVDGKDGTVLDAIVEDNPEDWSVYNQS